NTGRNPSSTSAPRRANSGPRWSITGRSIARSTRSGTLVGPGIWRKWRPVCGIIFVATLRTAIEDRFRLLHVALVASGLARARPHPHERNSVDQCGQRILQEIFPDQWDQCSSVVSFFSEIGHNLLQPLRNLLGIIRRFEPYRIANPYLHSMRWRVVLLGDLERKQPLNTHGNYRQVELGGQ